MIADVLQHAKVVFWDFDGVIKESVDVKTRAFMQLFEAYGPDVVQRVKAHHEAHGGMSRFDKIPLYLEWAGERAGAATVREFCDRFSALVMQAVIDADWVEGVREYLDDHRLQQRFVLVTATPQEEIEQILDVLGIRPCFAAVYGAPTPKAVGISDSLSRMVVAPHDAVAVGDSETDLAAAAANGVPFVLRRTSLNAALHARCAGASFDTLRVVRR